MNNFFDYLYICQQAINRIVEESKASPQTETGGILIGYETADNGLVITTATLPGPKAIKLKYFLALDAKFITNELRYFEKNFKHGYEGSWHKHLSFDNLEPSWVDKFLMYKVVKSKRYDIDQGVLIIANAKPKSILDIRCFLFKKGTKDYKEMNPILAADVYEN